jgi:hypothetical protein
MMKALLAIHGEGLYFPVKIRNSLSGTLQSGRFPDC